MRTLFDPLKDFASLYRLHLPPGKVKAYYEPFVGSGSMLGYVLDRYVPTEVGFSDVDPCLMNFWVWLKTDWDGLYGLIDQLRDQYLSLSIADKEDFQILIRDKIDFQTFYFATGEPEDAALFYFYKTMYVEQELWRGEEDFKKWGEGLNWEGGKGAWLTCCDWYVGVPDVDFILPGTFIFLKEPKSWLLEDEQHRKLMAYAQSVPEHSSVLLVDQWGVLFSRWANEASLAL